MRVFPYLSGVYQALLGRYDATRFSRNRPNVTEPLQSASQDVNSFTRLTMMKYARDAEQNDPLVQRVLDLIEANVVGTGINPTPSSSDETYNARALAAWDDWCKFADLTSRQHFYKLEGIVARAQALDGEIFAFMDEGESGRPRIQLIESHRVKSFSGLPYEYKSFIDCDGILLDQRGRPVFYCVENEVTAGAAQAGSFSIIPAAKIVHFYEPSRAGQYRGLTLFHAVIVTLTDLKQLEGFEMVAAKDSAERANIVYTENGEMPTGNLIGRSLTQQKDDGTAQSSEVYYEGKFGGRTVVMKRGDKWAQSEALRPSPAMREFWEYRTKRFCQGVGISYAAMEDYSGWGGAALRAAITCDNRFYEIRTLALTDGLQRIYEYVIGWSNDAGELGEKPADWFKCTWQPPRRATVDVGRESTAILNELRAGLRTYQDTYGELGQDWRGHLKQRAIEEAYIDELSAAYKVDRTRIAALGPNERMPANQEPVAPEPGKVTAVHAHTLEPVLAFMQSSALDVSEASETALPVSFVWMPAGKHDISAGTPSGEAWKGRVLCDEKSAAAVARDFADATSKGRRVFLDFNHDDGAASGWVKAFSWDAARGIVCSVEWSSEGERALRGKVYHSFSPAFLVDRESGRVAGLMFGHAAGGLVNAPAFGAAMPALIAARLGSVTPTKSAPGGKPETQQAIIMNKEQMIKLLASLKIQVPADANEEQLTALLSKHANEVQAAQTAQATELEKLKADAVLAKAEADKQAEVLAAKQKEIDDAKAAAVLASKQSPGVVVISPGVDAGSRVTAKPNAFEAVRAMLKETDSRKRGQIYCRELREFVNQPNVAEILAANSFGTVTSDLIILRALDLLKLNFPILRNISTDFSSEGAKYGQVVRSRIITVPTVTTYNTTTGYGVSDATTTDVSVTINAHKAITIGLNANEASGSNRDLFGEQVQAMNYALGKDLVDALYALFVIATYTNATTIATASITRITVPVAIAKALNARGVPMLNRTLLLNSDAFAVLAADTTIMNYATQQRGELIEGYQLPRLSGLQPIEAVNLPSTGNMTGFALSPDAAVIATRLPDDYVKIAGNAAHGAVSVVTNPDTGVSVLKTDFVDHTLGKAFSRIAWMYGVAAGQVASGQIIKSA